MKRVNRYQIDKLLEAQGHLCALCGGWMFPGDPKNPWTIDHIVPIAKGGKHVRENLQLAHKLCNQRKGAR